MVFEQNDSEKWQKDILAKFHQSINSSLLSPFPPLSIKLLSNDKQIVKNKFEPFLVRVIKEIGELWLISVSLFVMDLVRWWQQGVRYRFKPSNHVHIHSTCVLTQIILVSVINVLFLI